MKDKTVSVRGRLVRDLMKNVMETSLKQPIQSGEFRKNPVEPAWVCPGGYEYELIETENFRMEFLRPNGIFTGRVVLQLHGGGYIGPMKNIYRNFSVRYSKLSMGGDVLTIDYRVAPEYPYPGALEDAVFAYRWLVEEKGYQPSQIMVAGDSAGGGLALALVMYLRDHEISGPLGVIAMSPWLDLTNSGESYKTNYELDPLFGNSTENMLFHSAYVGGNDPRNPYISPLFGDFCDLPPVLFQVGSYEVLLDDSVEAEKRLRTAGGKAKLTIYEGMFHVFQMSLDLFPESRAAWEEVGGCLRNLYGIEVRPEGKRVRRVKGNKRRDIRRKGLGIRINNRKK